jgi:succinate dehydrogenase flavin-adding protein (antitoxin of CptAB toxin-antitoxin module)
MLRFLHLSRFAPNSSPTREKRELRFAGTPNTPPAPPEGMEGTPAAPVTPERQPNYTVDQVTEAQKKEMEELMAGGRRGPGRIDGEVKTAKSSEENDETGERKTGKPGAAETLQNRLEMIEESKRKNEKFIEKLKEMEDMVQSKEVREAAAFRGELKDLTDSEDMIRTEKNKTEQWDSVYGLLQEWEKGKMSAQDFSAALLQLLKTNYPSAPEIAALDEFIKTHQQELQEYIPIEGIDDIERDVKKWKDDALTPQSFIAAVTKYVQEVPDADKTVVTKLQEYLESKADEKLFLWEQNPEAIQASTRAVVIKEMGAIAKIDEMLAHIEKLQKTRKGISDAANVENILQGSNSQIEQRMEFYKKFDEYLAEAPVGNDAGHEEHHGHSSVLDALGIKLYTPMQIWNAIKELKEAYLEGYHAWSHHNEAELSQDFGSLFEWAPFGGRMKTYLQKRLDSSDDEQKGKYVEYLEGLNPNFLRLCYGPDSILAQEAPNDPNHARAILEYAAKKGFLYDLDESAGKDKKMILGHDLGHLLHDYDDHRLLDYYHKLRSENASGRDHQIKHGEERVHDIEYPPTFISELDHELHEGNIWEAVGICERAINRGLWSEISPWLLTTLLRHMRETPHIRKFMPQMALDKLGALGFYRAGGWSLGYLKGSRPKLTKWLKSGKSFDQAPDQGKGIYLIEQAVRKSTKFDFDHEQNGKRYLDHLVAKVMTTQILDGEVETFDGKKIKFDKKVSIFANEFNEYRNGNHIDMQGNTHPGIKDEDPDYYTTPGDNLLSGALPITEILAPTGSGKFQHEVFAPDYIGNILTVYKNLRSSGLNAEADNFRKEMGKKLTSHFRVVLQDTRTSGLPDYKVRISNIEQPELALKTLIEKGFLAFDPFVQTLWAGVENTGLGMAKKVVEQVDRSLALKMSAKKAELAAAKKDSTDPRVIHQMLEEWKAGRGSQLLDLPSIADQKFIMTKSEAPKAGAGAEHPLAA